jgi:cell division protein FtsA
MYAALDLGTSKICALIGEKDEQGNLMIHGEGTAPTQGIKGGVIVDMDSAVKCIIDAVTKAENNANAEVDEVVIGIAGRNLQCLNNRNEVVVISPLRGITEEDIRKLEEGARSVVIPEGRELLSVLNQGYYVDEDVDGTDIPPIGMVGTRLAVDVHIVHGQVAARQNVIRCINQAGFSVGASILQPMASAAAVLTPDERQGGVIMLDIGAGTIDMELYQNNAIRHTQVIHMGGNHITNDISYGLRISRNDAEAIKIKYGCATLSFLDHNDNIPITQLVGGEISSVPQRVLVEIIYPRLVDMFVKVQEELEQIPSKYKTPIGVILTGGVSKTKGIKEVAEKMFQLPVRLATPSRYVTYIKGLDAPEYATAIGLLLLADSMPGSNGKSTGKKGVKSFVDLIKAFFEKYF